MYLPTGRELIDPDHVLAQADVRLGMTVADFGCGTIGHYVFPAARMVGPNGKVYAIDILKSVLAGIESRRKLEGLANVETIWGDFERPKGLPLSDASVDVGLVINNLWMSKSRPALAQECVRVVKPGGKMVLVDWRTAGASFGPDPSSRLTAIDAVRLFEAVGMILEKEFDAGKYHWGAVMVKKL